MDIEDFFEEIDPDLLKYASAFRKSGFTSSVHNESANDSLLGVLMCFLQSRSMLPVL